MSSGYITIAVFSHPVKQHRNVEMLEIPYCGQSLDELKDKFTPGQTIIGAVDGVQNGVIHDGSEIALVPAAAFPAVPVAGAAWFGYGTFTAFAYALAFNIAVAIGLSYLGGMLFGQSLPDGKEEEGGQTFSWNPRTTQREGIVKPLCYGTNMHYGNVVAKWTDVSDSGDEVLYMILDYGAGPVVGLGSNTVYLQGQESGNYTGVTIQERLGTTNQTCMTGFEQNKLEYRPQELTITYGEAAIEWTTHNNFFDDIEYTLAFPRGLFAYGSDGHAKTWQVGIKVEISEKSADSWTTLLNTTISGNQLNPLYKLYKASEQGFNCIYGTQYDLKFTRTSDLFSEPGKAGEIIQLRSVREVVDTAFTRPGRALLGVTAVGTSRLSGHLNVKWVADDKLVRIFDGTNWGFAFTRNRAWIALDTLTQPIVSGDGASEPYAIERYEGFDPDRIDTGFFYEWAAWCDDLVPSGVGAETEERMTCDIRVDWQTDVWTLVCALAQVGRTHLYWQGNELTGWTDRAKSGDYTDLVTFDNIMLRSWKNAWAGYGEIAGGLDIFYRDSSEGYERKSLPIPNENAGLYTRKIKIEGMGITSRSLAARVGNHTLLRNELIKNVNSTTIYKDAMRYKLGQVVRLQATVPNWGQAYRVVQSQSDTTVQLDRTVKDAKEGDILYIRNYDVTNKVIAVKSYTVSSVLDKVVTIQESWDTGCKPGKNHLCAIGVAGTIKERRIISIVAKVNNYFDVVFETYDPNLFLSDDSTPNIPNADYAWALPVTDLLSEPTSKWEIQELLANIIPDSPDLEIPWLSNCSWTGSLGTTVTWAKRDATAPITFRYRGTTYSITADSTTDEFIYWDPTATTIFSTTDSAATALDTGHWLVCHNKAGVAYPAVPMQIVHGAIIQAKTITAAIGQIDDLAVNTLQIIDNAVTIPISAYTAGDIIIGADWTTVQELSFTSTGEKLFINWSVQVFKYAGDALIPRIKIFRDAVELYDSGADFPEVTTLNFAGSIEDEPGADTFTYYLKAYVGVTNRHKARRRFLYIHELKK